MKTRSFLPLASYVGLSALSLVTNAGAQEANQQPVPGSDNVSTYSTSKAVTFPATQFLANDMDPNGDALTITSVSPGGAGTVTLVSSREGEKSIIWKPTAAFQGTDTFFYTVSDGRGGSAQGTVNVRNPFVLNPGTYAGPAAGPVPAHANEGYVVLTTTKNGGFTARVRIAGQTFAFKAVMKLDGSFESDLVRGRSRKVLAFQFPVTGKDQPITGSITIGSQVSTFTLGRNLFGTGNAAPHAGYYTLAMPAPSDRWIHPQGIGFATLRVGTNGTAVINGKLNEGTAFSSTTYLKADGTLPLYASLYRTRGSFFGSASFTAGTPSKDVNGNDYTPKSVTGDLSWYRPARLHPKFYPRGFKVELDLSGATYVVPTVNSAALKATLSPSNQQATNAEFVASEDGLVRDIVRRGYVGVKPASGPYDADFRRGSRNVFRVNLRINPKTGTFNGTFFDRYRSDTRAFSGALLQGENAGFGVFKSDRYSGQVVIEPDANAS